MKRLILSLPLALTLSLPFTSSRADEPPFPMPLAERVNRATHVFVGRAKRLRVVDGQRRVLKPEPAHTASGVMVELEVEVEEVMFPMAWKPLKRIRVYFAGGIFSIREMRRDFLANRYVYLTRLNSGERKISFSPSYPWHLVEGLDKKAEIRGVLENRGAR